MVSSLDRLWVLGNLVLMADIRRNMRGRALSLVNFAIRMALGAVLWSRLPCLRLAITSSLLRLPLDRLRVVWPVVLLRMARLCGCAFPTGWAMIRLSWYLRNCLGDESMTRYLLLPIHVENGVGPLLPRCRNTLRGAMGSAMLRCNEQPIMQVLLLRTRDPSCLMVL